MANLKNLGFIPAKDRPSYQRIIMSLTALEKQGKTHFALGAPGPIALFNTDTGEEGVVEKFTDKDIQILDILRFDTKSDDEDEMAELAIKEWDKIAKAYYACLEDSKLRTIIMDTATEIWEILRMARFGRLTQVMPYQYGPVNAEFRRLIRAAFAHDKNLILLHKMKAQYVNDKRTGEYERAGFSDIGYLVQINARAYRYDEDDGGEFAMVVDDCRQNPDLVGMEFEGGMCNFDMLSQFVFGG